MVRASRRRRPPVEPPCSGSARWRGGRHTRGLAWAPSSASIWGAIAVADVRWGETAEYEHRRGELDRATVDEQRRSPVLADDELVPIDIRGRGAEPCRNHESG
jgi:hypothetical protein